MNGHYEVDLTSVEMRTSNETATGAKIEDIIAIVSHLHSETQLHNPIAAYFLEMCRFSLRRFNSEVQQRCIDDMAEHRGWGKGRGQGRKSPAAMRA